MMLDAFSFKRIASLDRSIIINGDSRMAADSGNRSRWRSGNAMVWVKKLSADEKLATVAACERFIADVLKPRFLPAKPNPLGHLVDIFGKWRGSKYGFSARYRSSLPDDDGEEFDIPFARLDHMEHHLAETRFDLMWYRHTGAWWRLHAAVTLDEALRLIDGDSRLEPPL